MKIKELIEILSQYDEDDYIVIADDYVNDIDQVKEIEVISAWGHDYGAIALLLGGQLGRKG